MLACAPALGELWHGDMGRAESRERGKDGGRGTGLEGTEEVVGTVKDKTGGAVWNTGRVVVKSL